MNTSIQNCCHDFICRIDQMYLDCTGERYIQNFKRINKFSKLLYEIDYELLCNIAHFSFHQSNEKINNMTIDQLREFVTYCHKKLSHIKYQYKARL